MGFSIVEISSLRMSVIELFLDDKPSLNDVDRLINKAGQANKNCYSSSKGLEDFAKKRFAIILSRLESAKKQLTQVSELRASVSRELDSANSSTLVKIDQLRARVQTMQSTEDILEYTSKSMKELLGKLDDAKMQLSQMSTLLPKFEKISKHLDKCTEDDFNFIKNTLSNMNAKCFPATLHKMKVIFEQSKKMFDILHVKEFFEAAKRYWDLRSDLEKRSTYIKPVLDEYVDNYMITS